MAYDARLYASPHFRWREFACRDWQHTPYPEDWRETRGRVLAVELEAIRAWLCAVMRRDVPLVLTSVYRTAAHNRECGGVRYSQHLYGRAADVQCPFGVTFADFREAVVGVAQREASKVRYIKVYRHQGFIHLDLRDQAALVIQEADP